MSLKAQITDDMKSAMRAKEAGKLATIRLILPRSSARKWTNRSKSTTPRPWPSLKR